MLSPIRWLDAHLDLAYLAVEGRDLRVPCAGADDGCVSLPDLREASVDVVLGTIYTAPGDDGPAGYPSSDDVAAAGACGARQLAVYETLAAAGELSIVRTTADLARPEPRPKLVLLMEGADPIAGPDDVPRWHARGLRVVGLTWMRGTRYAGGDVSDGPLTSRGVELVAALDEAGIVHDVSHLSDAAFDGLLACARGPVVATHSNCRVLVDARERHLRDEQIAAIADRGGIVGLNLYSGCLAARRRATLRDCVAHVEHVAEVMGHRRGVGLGSDMDGGFPPARLPEGVDRPQRLPRLADALRESGWTDAEIEGFRCGNWLRLLGKALPQPTVTPAG